MPTLTDFTERTARRPNAIDKDWTLQNPLGHIRRYRYTGSFLNIFFAHSNAPPEASGRSGCILRIVISRKDPKEEKGTLRFSWRG